VLGRRSSDVLRETVCSFYAHNFEFLSRLSQAGLRAINIVSPLPRNNDSYKVDVHDKVRQVVLDYHHSIGIQLVDVSDQTRDAESGALARDFWSATENDHIHGNGSWGEIVAESLYPRLISLFLPRK
jgi:hypothetical protein